MGRKSGDGTFSFSQEIADIPINQVWACYLDRDGLWFGLLRSSASEKWEVRFTVIMEQGDSTNHLHRLDQQLEICLPGEIDVMGIERTDIKSSTIFKNLLERGLMRQKASSRNMVWSTLWSRWTWQWHDSDVGLIDEILQNPGVAENWVNFLR
jgi:hypothetical protein